MSPGSRKVAFALTTTALLAGGVVLWAWAGAEESEAAADRSGSTALRRFARAEALLDRGDTDASLEAVRELLAAQPDYPGAELLAARAHWEAGRHADAAVHARRAAAADPEDPIAHLLLGRSLLDDGRTPDDTETADALFRAATLDPGPETARFLAEVFRRHDTPVAMHCRLGELFLQRRMPTEALAEYMHAAKTEPRNREVLEGINRVRLEITRMRAGMRPPPPGGLPRPPGPPPSGSGPGSGPGSMSPGLPSSLPGRDGRSGRDGRDIKGDREGKDSRDGREGNNGRDTRDPMDGKSVRPSKGERDAGSPKAPGEPSGA